MTAAAISHENRAHALLSASGAHRWLHCTPSPHLEEQHPDTPSEAAEEGTAAHEQAEYQLRTLLGENPPKPKPTPYDNEEMHTHAKQYAQWVLDHTKTTTNTPPVILVEQRIDFSRYAPGGFGTADVMAIHDTTLTITDFKYGKGVPVSAENNPQMRLYALGALDQVSMIYPITQVTMRIYQPRLNAISEETLDVATLKQWGKEVVKPAAQAAAKGEGALTPGEWCQFCRHAPMCPAQAQALFAPLPATTTPPESPTPHVEVGKLPEATSLTNEQVASIVGLSAELKKWLTKVEDHALKQALAGHTYPGLKLVEGRSVRTYTDQDAVAAAVAESGHDPWQKKLLTVTAMTKLLGKKDFDAIVGPYITKPAGKPALVPASDKRPALEVATPETVFTPINPPAKD